MMLNLRELDNDSISKWDELVYSLPGGTIFHTVQWIKMIEKTQSLNAKYIGIFQADTIIGIFPLFIKKFLFIKVAASPFIVEDTPYMGPVMDPSLISDFLSALSIYLKRNKIHYLRIITNNSFDYENSDNSYHFTYKKRYILDINRTEENLWKNLEGRCRTAIRKAQKSEVVIYVMQDKNDIEKYYSMLEQVFHRHNKPFPVNSKEFYYSIRDIFGQSNAIFLFAEYKKKLIGGLILILDRKQAYYLNAASDYKFNFLNVNNLLLWTAILEARKYGAEQYDFLGPDSPLLDRYKKSFGATSVDFTCIERASSIWVALLRDKYPEYKQKIKIFKNIFRK